MITEYTIMKLCVKYGVYYDEHVGFVCYNCKVCGLWLGGYVVGAGKNKSLRVTNTVSQYQLIKEHVKLHKFEYALLEL